MHVITKYVILCATCNLYILSSLELFLFFYMPLPSFLGKKNTPGISALQDGAPGPYYKWIYP